MPYLIFYSENAVGIVARTVDLRPRLLLEWTTYDSLDNQEMTSVVNERKQNRFRSAFKPEKLEAKGTSKTKINLGIPPFPFCKTHAHSVYGELTSYAQSFEGNSRISGQTSCLLQDTVSKQKRPLDG